MTCFEAHGRDNRCCDLTGQVKAGCKMATLHPSHPHALWILPAQMCNTVATQMARNARKRRWRVDPLTASE